MNGPMERNIIRECEAFCYLKGCFPRIGIASHVCVHEMFSDH